jgi:hypothetical protein
MVFGKLECLQVVQKVCKTWHSATGADLCNKAIRVRHDWLMQVTG